MDLIRLLPIISFILKLLIIFIKLECLEENNDKVIYYIATVWR